MEAEKDPKFFALLVHQGLLEAETVKRAFASGEPHRFLIENALLTEEQWRQWVESEGGLRPTLSRYAVEDLIGEGGMARVFRAIDRTSGETVALKVLRPKMCKDSTAVESFVREAKLLIELRHEHLVKGKRVAREGATIFCAMELVDGVCLQNELGSGGRIDEEAGLEIVAQVAEAISYLRGRGLVHRDVKPGNIMLTGEGRAVLLDLGFAVRAAAGALDEAATTSGTAHYISPEQARGVGDLDVRADIYSLGATLYHLVTGSLPFEGASSEEVMAKQVLEALSGQAIRELGLSPQLHYFIEKMMAKEKEIRFQDPDALIAEVRAHLEHRAFQRRADEEAERKKKARRRRRFRS